MDPFATVAITVFAIVVSVLLSVLMKKYGGRDRIIAIQKEVSEVNKQYFDAGKKGDKKKVAELEEKMKDLPKLMTESMFLNLKSLVIMLPLFLAATWFVKFVFPNFTIELPIQIPVPRSFLPPVIEMKSVFGTYGWFILSLVVFGGIAQLVLSKIQKKNP